MGGGGGGGGGGAGSGGPAIAAKGDRFWPVTTMLPPRDSSRSSTPRKPSFSQSVAEGSPVCGVAARAKVVGGADVAISAAMAVRLTMDRKRLVSRM
jgi:hypothetical protein